MALRPKYKLEPILEFSPSLLLDFLMLDSTHARLLLAHPTSIMIIIIMTGSQDIILQSEFS